MASTLRQIGQKLFSPLISVGSAYNKTAVAFPFATGVITSGVKTSAADLFAQKVIEGKDEVDWKRHAVYCLFGFGYLGGFQYYLYNVKFVQWCQPITNVIGHRGVAPVKMLMDQCLHHPFMYFPTFFTLKAIVEGKPLSHAVEKYTTEIWDSVKALWSIWMPAQLVNFMFVPRHLRVPYVAGVSFVWTVVLSVMQGKFDSEKSQQYATDKLEEIEKMLPEISGVGEVPGVLPPAPVSLSSTQKPLDKGFAAMGAEQGDRSGVVVAKAVEGPIEKDETETV